MVYLILMVLILTFGFNLWLSILNYQNRNAKIPYEVKDVYDQVNYQKWLNYTMENYRLDFIVNIISFVLIFGLLISGFFPALDHFVLTITANIYLQTLIFIGLYFIIEYVISIVFSYFQQFVIEEKYGFNKMTIKTFIIDQVKKTVLTLILGGGFIFALTYLYYRVGDLFYILIFASIILIILFINIFFIKLFIPLFNKLSPLEEGELKQKIVHFAQSVGYEVNKISVIDSSKRSTKLNAFFTGIGKFKQVVLYDTLIAKMTDDQIVSVLAHEIGHAKKKHINKNLLITIITISLYLLVLLYSVKSTSLSIAFGFSDLNLGFGLVIFSILISPISILIEAVTSHISRKFEYEADYYAVSNGFKKEMEESLKVLARENYANLTPHPLYVKMRYSHPPIGDRVRAIRKTKY